MISSRRDYILRLIEEAAQMLARLISQRASGRYEDSLKSTVQACERLFGVEADRLFQFTPDQHFAMLTADQPPELARDRVLLYAALNAEAARTYAALGNRAMARASFVNALRFTLRAGLEFPAGDLPVYAPSVEALLESLKAEPLDADTAALLAESRAG